MTQMRVEPSEPVKDDVTGAAAGVDTGSGRLYAPETKEQAKVVVPEPEHECNPPEKYSENYYSKEAHDLAATKLPEGTLFRCECGKWLERIFYYSTYWDEYTHYWHEVGRWDFKARRRIRMLESEETARNIYRMAQGGLDIE